MRTVPGPTDRVVVVGAGLAGLSAALRLAGSGRQVTVVEQAAGPGGLAGQLRLGGYTFDAGPAVLTMPGFVADALAAVGEQLEDRLRLVRLEPLYRTHHADGTVLDVYTHPERMAEEVRRVCGPAAVDGYLRYVTFVTELFRLQLPNFIDRNLDSLRDTLRPALLRLALLGGFRRLERRAAALLRDPRLRRALTFQAMYAGVSPYEALALYGVITYMDCVAGGFFPDGGMHSVPVALADAAARHGVRFRYRSQVSHVDVRGGRATGVVTTTGDHLTADVVLLTVDLPAAYGKLLPAVPVPRRVRQLRPAPSCFLLHAGSSAAYTHIQHHNVHFGHSWRDTFREIEGGRLMSDPSFFVANPTRTDPGLAPPGRQTYYVLFPVPHLGHGRLDWSRIGRGYRDEVVATLEARGYQGFGASVEAESVVTPADWAAAGLSAGTPFAAAHRWAQTGPFRPSTLPRGLPNVVFAGAGTQPGVGIPMVLLSGRLAAERITGAVRASAPR